MNYLRQLDGVPNSRLLESLCHAIRGNQIKKVKDILLKNPGIAKKVSEDRNTVSPWWKRRPYTHQPLWDAMLYGRKTIVELLIDFGADPNDPLTFEEKKKFSRLTFLQGLAKKGEFWVCYQNVAEALIFRGADVNFDFNSTRRSALQIAISEGNTQYVEFLLLNGGKIKDHVKDVFVAPKTKQKEILELLIKYNQLDANYCCESEGNYLHMTFLKPTFSLAPKSAPKLDINVVEIAKTLLNFGVLVNGLDASRQTPLSKAICLNNIELVSVLIENGADPNFTACISASTPLHIAIEMNAEDIVELLLSRGVDVNAKFEDGYSAMHLACYYHMEKTINLLMQKGADISTEDINGDTPFFVLKQEQHRDPNSQCINLMIKEIAKRIFSNDLTISKKDIKLIQADPNTEKFYQLCMEELFEISTTVFYYPYSYYCVLKMSKNIKKLAKLTKNEDFVSNFEQNLEFCCCYKNDLLGTLKKAIEAKDQLLIVESRLKSIFDNFFPEVIIRKLVDYLVVQDLPLE